MVYQINKSIQLFACENMTVLQVKVEWRMAGAGDEVGWECDALQFDIKLLVSLIKKGHLNRGSAKVRE